MTTPRVLFVDPTDLDPTGLDSTDLDTVAPSRSVRWLAGTAPRRQLVAHHLEDVTSVLEAAEAEAEAGAWVVGFLTYEAGAAFEEALTADDRPRRDRLPLAWWGVFDELQEVAPPAPPPPAAVPRLDWRPRVEETTYLRAIDAIHRRIAAGDTYQVNYTFFLEATVSERAGRSLPSHALDSLFAALWHAQGGAHSALIDLGDVAILSASPELFVARDGRSLRTRPMKGTTPRGRFPAEDAARAAQLHSEKNHAENLMIVDMLRNDLGRIAHPGSVRVERLFAAERYPTVHQLTSDIVASTDATTTEVLGALFPCASITGAPKIAASRIIRELEPEPRGLYTGAIGWLAPGRRAHLGVAIRTVTVDRTAGIARYGVGGGIVTDSEGDAELRECFAKARVLTARRPRFDLLETLRWDRTESAHNGVFLRHRHLDRMAASAAYFAYPFDRERVSNALDRAITSMPTTAGASARDCAKLRLLVAADGAPRVEIHPAGPMPRALEMPDHPLDAPLPTARWRLDDRPVEESDPFLFHKTTHRSVYEEARARHPGFEDVLLWNRRGELTESTLANLVVHRKGRWLTPPVTSGLLAGTLRQELLERGWLEEATLPLDELDPSDDLYGINSVRGWTRITLTR